MIYYAQDKTVGYVILVKTLIFTEMETIEELLKDCQHDGQRMAKLIELEKWTGAKKTEIRENVLANFADHGQLKVTVSKQFEVDPTSNIGRNIANLQKAIKEMEVEAKDKGLGKYKEVKAISLVTPVKTPTPKVTVNSENAANYESFFFGG